jgi:triosephosphate isomerase
MSRKPMIVGNWKMNKTTSEATRLAQDISYAYASDYAAVDVVLCPPFTDLRSVRVVLGFDKSPVALGAQDVYWEREGAFTGEISPGMLAELGCAYCIIGHSERREHFGETDETVNRKAKALVAARIAPIICCGESLTTRDAGDALGFVTAQLRAALDGVSAEEAAAVVIAYEPIWAIGTGRTAAPEQAEEVCATLRVALAKRYDDRIAEGIRILYGGSMKPANVAQFVPLPNIDGGLIGGAALVSDDFIDLVKTFA